MEFLPNFKEGFYQIEKDSDFYPFFIIDTTNEGKSRYVSFNKMMFFLKHRILFAGDDVIEILKDSILNMTEKDIQNFNIQGFTVFLNYYELSFGRTNKHGIRIHLEMYKSETKMWTMNIQVFKVTDSSSEFIDQRSDILDKKLSLKQALDWFKGWLAIPDNQELIYKIAELEPTTF